MVAVRIDEKSLKVMVKLENLAVVGRRAMRQAWFKVGRDIKKTAETHILATDKSGILYGVIVRGGKKRLVKLRAGLRTHRSSAPGQPPANLNSDLRRSLKYQIRGTRRLEFSANTDYARRLELGGGAIKPRPYMIRSIKDNLRNIEKHFEDEIGKAFKHESV